MRTVMYVECQWFHNFKQCDPKIVVPEPYQAGPEVEHPQHEPLFWWRWALTPNIYRPTWRYQ